MRVRRAPVERSEPQIQITERTANGDLAQIEGIAPFRRLGIDYCQTGMDLLHLALGPVIPTQGFGSHEGFVTGQQRRIEDAVAHRLFREDLPASGARRRQQLAVAQLVQVLADDPTVVEYLAIVGDKCRYFAQRVLGDNGLITSDGIGCAVDLFNPISESEFEGNHHALAHVRRERGVENFHG